MNTMMNFATDQAIKDGSKELLVEILKVIDGRKFGEIELAFVTILVNLSNVMEREGLTTKKDVLENIIKHFQVNVEVK